MFYKGPALSSLTLSGFFNLKFSVINCDSGIEKKANSNKEQFNSVQQYSLLCCFVDCCENLLNRSN